MVEELRISREFLIIPSIHPGFLDLDHVLSIIGIRETHGLEDDVVMDGLAGVLGIEGLVVCLLDCLRGLVLIMGENVFYLPVDVLFLEFLLLPGLLLLLAIDSDTVSGDPVCERHSAGLDRLVFLCREEREEGAEEEERDLHN